MDDLRFPFGAPLSKCRPSADSERRLFVLGAYPSALHVTWHPPKPHRRVLALPVADEPEPFWTGHDQAVHLEAWRASVGFHDGWGRVEPCGRFNGSSGAWVEERVLAPLGAKRTESWITDCLDTYRASNGVAGRIADTYAPFAIENEAAVANLLPHPDEHAIVREALATETDRLRAELDRAKPEIVVTLGNAALRVLREIVTVVDDPGCALVADERYGTARRITLGSRASRWLPLAHPAAPTRYQLAHERWIESAHRVSY